MELKKIITIINNAMNFFNEDATVRYIRQEKRRRQKQEKRELRKRVPKMSWGRFFRHLLAYSVPFVGLAIIILQGYKIISFGEPWDQIANIFAAIFIGGGLLSLAMNVLKMFSYFERKLSDILYGKEFLKDRTDLPMLWSNVTEALYHQRFPKIAKKIHALLKDKYFNSSNNYYSSFLELKLNFSHNGGDFITSKDAILQKINVADESLKTFEMSSKLECELSEREDPITYNRLLELKINETPLYKYKEGDDEKNVFTIKEKNYVLTIKRSKEIYEKRMKNVLEYSIDVFGHQQYTIERVMEKKYNVIYNPLKRFVANHIYRRMSVLITHSDSLYIDHTGCGTIDEFTERISAEVCDIHLEYNGIILPKQGIVIGISKRA
jgi:hypothetical protein